jgi:hypothetical protein
MFNQHCWRLKRLQVKDNLLKRSLVLNFKCKKQIIINCSYKSGASQLLGASNIKKKTAESIFGILFKIKIRGKNPTFLQVFFTGVFPLILILNKIFKTAPFLRFSSHSELQNPE